MDSLSGRFFFLYFSILFFTKIFFLFSKFTRIYPAAPLLGGRHLAAPLPGGRGFFVKTFAKNLRAGPWRTGRPAAGRPAPRAAQQWGGGHRPPGIRATGSPTLYKGWLVPHPSFASLKFQKPRKEREGGRERGEALPDFRAGDCR